jgi:ABC-type lipoprotein export system ATPase subunit
LGSLHDEGRTVVLITHEHEVAACAQRTVELRDGRIAGPGSTPDVLMGAES